MRRVAFLALALGAVLASAATASAGEADEVLGTWLTAPSEEGRAHLQIRQEGGTFFGEIVWLEKPTYPPDDDQGMGGQAKVDRENPDPSLRSRPIIGLRLLKGFTYDGDSLWAGGTIYDPENGKTYKAKMRLSDDNQTLKVRGFIGFSLIGRTEIWTRMPDADSGSEPGPESGTG